MSATQKRNSEMVDILRPDFQPRYEPNFAYGNTASMHQAIPALRGYWPLTSFDATPTHYDQSGQSRNLTTSGNVYQNITGLVGYGVFAGAQYLYRADEPGLDILGTETYLDAGIRGFAMGGWFRCSNAPGAAETLMSKYNPTGNQRSYRMLRTAAGNIQALISTNGVAVVSIASTATVAAGAWTHCAINFVPSTTLSVFVNGEETQLAAGIPAAIFNSTADFFIGAEQLGAGATNYFTGRARDCFLSVSRLSPTIIKNIYQQTRAMFGV